MVERDDPDRGGMMSDSQGSEHDPDLGWMTGRRVCVLVWNGFTHDARVLRECRSLLAAGAFVRVACIQTRHSCEPHEVTGEGLEIVRVATYGWLSALALLPGRLFRRLTGRAVGDRAVPSAKPIDARLAFAGGVLHAYWKLIRTAVQMSPDFVHANDVNTLLPAWLAARLCGARLIYDAHEISADREGYRHVIPVVRLLEGALGRAADGRITTTQARADWFVENYAYPDMAVVQNRPEYQVVSADLLRERYEVPDDSVLVLYQGGLQPGRGLRNLIAAVRPLSRVQLFFVGDGSQRAELEEGSREIRDRVHFVGQVPLEELPYWTSSADVGVQTIRNTCLNHYTTDSNKLFEYLMAGLPVIASDFPEIRSIMEQAEAGLLVDPEDVGQISAGLARLVDDAELRERYARNAVLAREGLDWQSQTQVFLDVYHAAQAGD